MTQNAQITLDGDYKGHAFRGNQHLSASGESRTAVRSSQKAKYAEMHSDKNGQKKAHRSAHYAHMAAAEDAKSKITLNYHRKMAKFHAGRAGISLDGVDGLDDIEGSGYAVTMDATFRGDAQEIVIRDQGKETMRRSVSDFRSMLLQGGFPRTVSTMSLNELVKAYNEHNKRVGEPQIATLEASTAWLKAQGTFDAASDFQDSIVGRILKGGQLMGRAVIGGDGKAMVFVGDSEDQRVTFKSSGPGNPILQASWSDDDAPDMVEWLLAPKTEDKAEPFTHAGFLIYRTKVNVAGEVKEYWAVQSIENKERETRGERQVGGDSLLETLEQSKTEAERQAARMEADAKWKQEAAEQAKAEADAAAARIAMYADFVAYKGYSAPMAERARLALEKAVKWNGEPTTIKAMVEALVDEGRTIGTDANGLRGLESTDGRFMDEKATSKIGMDYAEYLISKKPVTELGTPTTQGQEVIDPKTQDRDFLMSVIDGSNPDLLEPDLAVRIEAAFTRNSEDAEMVSLFGQAVNAYTQAMLNATAGV